MAFQDFHDSTKFNESVSHAVHPLREWVGGYMYTYVLMPTYTYISNATRPQGGPFPKQSIDFFLSTGGVS